MSNDGTRSDDSSADPPGAVPFAEAIESLRAELTRMWSDERDASLRFKLSPVELTLQVAVSVSGKGSAGLRWWLIELGRETTRGSMVTQTIKVTLEPIMATESE